MSLKRKASIIVTSTDSPDYSSNPYQSTPYKGAAKLNTLASSVNLTTSKKASLGQPKLETSQSLVLPLIKKSTSRSLLSRVTTVDQDDLVTIDAESTATHVVNPLLNRFATVQSNILLSQETQSY